MPSERDEDTDPCEEDELPYFSARPQPLTSQLAHSTVTTYAETDWVNWQQACTPVQRIREYLKTGHGLTPAEREEAPAELLQLWAQRERLEVHGGLLYRTNHSTTSVHNIFILYLVSINILKNND